MILSETASAKLNLALHVRGKLPDGRHALETIFAFCTDGDRLQGGTSDALTLAITGPFAAELDNGEQNLVIRAARALAEAAGVEPNAALTLTKNLPVASGIGGGSADAAAALRLLTRLWGIDPAHAKMVAPALGSDVPACLTSRSARGTGAGDRLERLTLDYISTSGAPVLLVNPMIALSTARVFVGWDGVDRGPLDRWYEGRNDLEAPARNLVPEISDVLDWLVRHDHASMVRMSGSGATCFAFFSDDRSLAAAASELAHDRPNWWHLATHLR